MVKPLKSKQKNVQLDSLAKPCQGHIFFELWITSSNGLEFASCGFSRQAARAIGRKAGIARRAVVRCQPSRATLAMLDDFKDKATVCAAGRDFGWPLQDVATMIADE
jgi:hypothetical protein